MSKKVATSGKESILTTKIRVTNRSVGLFEHRYRITATRCNALCRTDVLLRKAGCRHVAGVYRHIQGIDRVVYCQRNGGCSIGRYPVRNKNIQNENAKYGTERLFETRVR